MGMKNSTIPIQIHDKKMSSERYTRERREPNTNITSQTEDVEAYDSKPGICLIINNMTFKALGFRNMPEQDKDEDILRVVFGSLDFDVAVHRNLTANEMNETIKEYSKKEHKGVFILYILSHGGENDVVFGIDGGEVTVSALEEFFIPSSCRSLTGIPKIFLIDACRGSNRETQHKIQQPCGSKGSKGGFDSSSCTLRSSCDPIQSARRSDDFAIIYASSPGMVAHIDKNGSDFTQNLQQVILEADENDDFEGTIMLKVINKCKSQVVHRSLRLRRRYFIKRHTIINKIQQLCKKHERAINDWLGTRQRTIQKIEEIIEKLITYRKKVNATRIAGGGAAVAGGVLAVVGFALASVTGGAGLAVGIAGVGIATAGGAATAGAGIADAFIQNNNVEKAKEHYERDQKKLVRAIKLVKDMQECIDISKEKCGTIGDANVAANFFAAGIQIGYRGTAVGLKVAEVAVGGIFEIGTIAIKVGGPVLRGVAIAGIAVNVLLIPIDLIQMVQAAINMAQGNENEAVKKLRDFSERLQAEQNAVEEKIKAVK